jgi:hypothetical protein
MKMPNKTFKTLALIGAFTVGVLLQQVGCSHRGDPSYYSFETQDCELMQIHDHTQPPFGGPHYKLYRVCNLGSTWTLLSTR